MCVYCGGRVFDDVVCNFECVHAWFFLGINLVILEGGLG
jgi:hypothetical protein